MKKVLFLIALMLSSPLLAQVAKGWNTSEAEYSQLQRLGWEFQFADNRCWALMPKRTEQGKGVGKHTAPQVDSSILNARQVVQVKPQADGFCHAVDAVK